MRNLPDLPRTKTIDRPKNPPGFAAMPTGPRMFAKRDHPTLLGGPGEPPPGFVRATTSGSEWMLFWAGRMEMEPNEDPRRPPFFGTRDPAKFVYQYAYTGGRHILGGQVVDYVIFPYAGNQSILVRLQTERFHIFTDAQKQAYDRLQARELGKYGAVYDIFEQQIIGDPTGLAAILAWRDCLRGVREPDPLLTGQARRVRV